MKKILIEDLEKFILSEFKAERIDLDYFMSHLDNYIHGMLHLDIEDEYVPPQEFFYHLSGKEEEWADRPITEEEYLSGNYYLEPQEFEITIDEYRVYFIPTDKGDYFEKHKYLCDENVGYISELIFYSGVKDGKYAEDYDFLFPVHLQDYKEEQKIYGRLNKFLSRYK